MSAESGPDVGKTVVPGLLVRERVHPERREVVISPGTEGPLFNIAQLSDTPDGMLVLNPLSAHSVTLGEVEFASDVPVVSAEDAMAAERRYWESERARGAVPAPIIEASIRELPKMYGDWGTSRYLRYGDVYGTLSTA